MNKNITFHRGVMNIIESTSYDILYVYMYVILHITVPLIINIIIVFMINDSTQQICYLLHRVSDISVQNDFFDALICVLFPSNHATSCCTSTMTEGSNSVPSSKRAFCAQFYCALKFEYNIRNCGIKTKLPFGSISRRDEKCVSFLRMHKSCLRL